MKNINTLKWRWLLFLSGFCCFSLSFAQSTFVTTIASPDSSEYGRAVVYGNNIGHQILAESNTALSGFVTPDIQITSLNPDGLLTGTNIFNNPVLDFDNQERPQDMIYSNCGTLIDVGDMGIGGTQKLYIKYPSTTFTYGASDHQFNADFIKKSTSTNGFIVGGRRLNANGQTDLVLIINSDCTPAASVANIYNFGVDVFPESATEVNINAPGVAPYYAITGRTRGGNTFLFIVDATGAPLLGGLTEYASAAGNSIGYDILQNANGNIVIMGNLFPNNTPTSTIYIMELTTTSNFPYPVLQAIEYDVQNSDRECTLSMLTNGNGDYVLAGSALKSPAGAPLQGRALLMEIDQVNLGTNWAHLFEDKTRFIDLTATAAVDGYFAIGDKWYENDQKNNIYVVKTDLAGQVASSDCYDKPDVSIQQIPFEPIQQYDPTTSFNQPLNPDLVSTTIDLIQIFCEDEPDPCTDLLSISCISPIEVNLDANCQALIPTINPTILSGCPPYTITQSPTAGTVITANTVVTITVTDDIGQMVTCDVTVNVVDITPPTISCPADVSVTTLSMTGTTVTFPPPVADDNCSVSFSCDYNSGDFFPCGTTTVTCTATDGAGLMATCTFDITVTCDPGTSDPCPAPIITNTFSTTIQSDASEYGRAAVYDDAIGLNLLAESNATFPFAIPNIQISQLLPNGTLAPGGTVLYNNTNPANAKNQERPEDMIYSDCGELVSIGHFGIGSFQELYIENGTNIVEYNLGDQMEADFIKKSSSTSGFIVGGRRLQSGVSEMVLIIHPDCASLGAPATIYNFGFDVFPESATELELDPTFPGISGNAPYYAVTGRTGNNDVFIFVVDVNGVVQFNGLVPYTVAGGNTMGLDIMQISNGNLMILAQRKPTPSTSNVFLMELMTNIPSSTPYFPIMQIREYYIPNSDAETGYAFIRNTDEDYVIAGTIHELSASIGKQAFLMEIDHNSLNVNWTHLYETYSSFTDITNAENNQAYFAVGEKWFEGAGGMQNIYAVKTDVNGAVEGIDCCTPVDVPDTQLGFSYQTAIDALPVGVPAETIAYESEEFMPEQRFCQEPDPCDDPLDISCVSPITLDLDQNCEAIVPTINPTILSGCPPYTITQSPVAGTIISTTTSVTVTVTDANAQVATCNVTINVIDNIPPTIVCPSDVIVNTTNATGTTVTFPPPVANDNCSVSFTCDYNSGDFFPCGTTTVTCTATDGAGLMATCTFDITVNCEDDDCLEVIEPSIECDPNNPNHYIYCFRIVNNSGLTAQYAILTNPPPGFQFGINVPSPTPTSSLLITLDPAPLPDGATSNKMFVKILPTSSITTPTPICFNIGLQDVNFQDCCNDPEQVCTTLEPCCDPCDNSDIFVESLVVNDEECCKKIDVINECNEDIFTKIETAVITPGVQFGFHALGGLDAADWSVPTTTSTSITWAHNSGFIPVGTADDIIQYCLDDINDPSEIPQEVVLRWYGLDAAGNDVVLCTDTIVTYCEIDYNCLEISEQEIKCDNDNEKYTYCFKVTNQSDIPFNATDLIIGIDSPTGLIFSSNLATAEIINLSTPLGQGDMTTLTTCFESPSGFPSSATEVVFKYRLAYFNGSSADTCCFENILDTIPMPDCCPQDTMIVHNDTDVIGTGVYHTSQMIVSSADITPQVAVIYKGGSIKLKPGFHAQAGTNFTALIDTSNPCDTCCVDDPLLELDWLQVYVGADVQIDECKLDGDCVYIIEDCASADVQRRLFDCHGNLLCYEGGITGANCDLFSQLTDCVTLQACPTNNNAIETRTSSLLERVQLQNQPNPFTQTTTIQFYLPQSTSATLRVLDRNGKMIFLQSAFYQAGWNTVELEDTGNWSSGIYFYRIETAEQVVTKSMMLLRE
ncbi:MAG: HYR domain-containing protein [Bacteroidota bacterium]